MSHTDPLTHSGLPYIVSKLDYGCLAARHDYRVAYFHLFCQKNNVPIDACSNIIFIHILASVIGIKDLFQELIRIIDKTCHVVESNSFNSKRIAMVNDGIFDLIYRGVLISCYSVNWPTISM